jgi:hypothetical protein
VDWILRITPRWSISRLERAVTHSHREFKWFNQDVPVYVFLLGRFVLRSGHCASSTRGAVCVSHALFVGLNWPWMLSLDGRLTGDFSRWFTNVYLLCAVLTACSMTPCWLVICYRKFGRAFCLETTYFYSGVPRKKRGQQTFSKCRYQITNRNVMSCVTNFVVIIPLLQRT